jgi:hypothetical protein
MTGQDHAAVPRLVLALGAPLLLRAAAAEPSLTLGGGAGWLLIAASVALTVLFGALPQVLWARRKPRPARWPYVVASVVLALFGGLVIVPVFWAIGAILVTGRIM